MVLVVSILGKGAFFFECHVSHCVDSSSFSFGLLVYCVGILRLLFYFLSSHELSSLSFFFSAETLQLLGRVSGVRLRLSLREGVCVLWCLCACTHTHMRDKI